MGIPIEEYNRLEAKDRLKQKEDRIRIEAVCRSMSLADQRYASLEMLNFKLTLGLIVSVGYGAWVTLKMWGVL